jgi:hypothetical protein
MTSAARRATTETGRPSPADDLGPPVAYTALADGVPVYDRDRKRVGVVERLMVVGGIFDGIVVHTYPLPGRHVYARADQIVEIRERGVLLSVPAEELSEVVRTRRRRRNYTLSNPLEARLRRAWDWITERL